MDYITFFSDITMADAGLVAPKNASLGEMIRQLQPKGIRIPLGFAITVKAYWKHLEANNLIPEMKKIIHQLENKTDIGAVQQAGKALRSLIYNAPLPDQIADEITKAYNLLAQQYDQTHIDVAIRSSATAEDLPTASFAGQQDSFLNVQGVDQVIDTTKKCMASLFTDRSIVYRIDKHFDHFAVGLAVGVQKMVRSDKASFRCHLFLGYRHRL